MNESQQGDGNCMIGAMGLLYLSFRDCSFGEDASQEEQVDCQDSRSVKIQCMTEEG